MKEYKFEVHRVIKIHETKKLSIEAEDYDDAVDKLYETACDREDFSKPYVFFENDALKAKKKEVSALYIETQMNSDDDVWLECNLDNMEYELIE